ncbi:undecaprenyl-diphosphatase [Bacillus pakistanensis]|uniref:Undecaprenyl-diphosphatase n=1 Tax=Rossellomorea pakistanensis TaxID=992288 RepID=A0ABS2N8I7_9BACI|nr:phosphatase PAP2 family protein [Bacillus pakistanensis]MBM7584180.1 undecaprenyl-diphosphatase [Bacillus pakistanensis]
MEKGTKKKSIIIVICLALLLVFSWGFVEIVDELQENEIELFDNKIINVIQQNISPQLTLWMSRITFLGGVKWLTILTVLVAIVLFIMKKSPLAFYMILTVSFGGAFNWFLKWIFKRQRPDIQPLIEQSGYSFPSGHSMGSFIFYGALAFVLFRLFDYLWLKIVTSALSLLLVCFIGISRIYLGVHYPSDIIAGFTAGGAWLVLSIFIYHLIRTRVPKMLEI